MAVVLTWGVILLLGGHLTMTRYIFICYNLVELPLAPRAQRERKLLITVEESFYTVEDSAAPQTSPLRLCPKKELPDTKSIVPRLRNSAV